VNDSSTNDDDRLIGFSLVHVLLEPVIAIFIKLFCFCKFCKNSCKKKQELLDLGQEKLDEELEIVNFVKLVNQLE